MAPMKNTASVGPTLGSPYLPPRITSHEPWRYGYSYSEIVKLNPTQNKNKSLEIPDEPNLRMNPAPEGEFSVNMTDRFSDGLRVSAAPSGFSVRRSPLAKISSRALPRVPAPGVGSGPGFAAPPQSLPYVAPMDFSSTTTTPIMDITLGFSAFSQSQLQYAPMHVSSSTTAPIPGSSPGFAASTQSRAQNVHMNASSTTTTPTTGSRPGFAASTQSQPRGAPMDVSSMTTTPLMGSMPGLVAPIQRIPQNKLSGVPLIQRAPQSNPAGVPLTQPFPQDIPASVPLIQRGPQNASNVPPLQRVPQNTPAGDPLIQRIPQNTTADVAPPQRSPQDIPANIAPPQRVPQNTSANIAPIQRLPQNIPANVAPLQRAPQRTPANVAPIQRMPENMPANVTPLQRSPQNIPANVGPVQGFPQNSINRGGMRYHDLSERGQREKSKKTSTHYPNGEVAMKFGKECFLPVIPGESGGASPSSPDEMVPVDTYNGFVPGQWSSANLGNPNPNANLPWELPPLGTPGSGDELDDAWLSAENVSNSSKTETHPSNSGDPAIPGANVADSQKRKTPPTENLSNTAKRRTRPGATDFEGRYGIPWDPRPYIDTNADQEQPASSSTISPQPAKTNSKTTSVSSKRRPSASGKTLSDPEKSSSGGVAMSGG